MMKPFSILRESLIMPKIGKKNYYAFNFAMGLQFQSKALPELDMKRDKKQILN